MITFYPGPSKVYPQIEKYLQDAFHSGILSVNHRSDVFMEMLRSTIESVKAKLDIPADYEVYFVSSATECWEIIAQSLIGSSSLHIYNGAFGEKWLEYTAKIKPGAEGFSFGLNEAPDIEELNIDLGHDVICITHNETSNGTALPLLFHSDLRSLTNQIIAVDATSSMAGAILPWKDADVWYASVQKCFGLPAGMAVMVVSPAAIHRAEQVADRSFYNSLLFTRENFLKYQTPYTPNALGIYLLGRVMEHVAPIVNVASEIHERAREWYAFLPENGYELLVNHRSVQSDTVIAVQADREKVTRIKSMARQAGLQLGNGYGKWKETSFRIANFPAITITEISLLRNFLFTISRS
ncbi:alanine--glyoxylate aminotransferase family protein [Dyadobacter psychrotolerans]|uniref:Alanine--glyoxylate aminotransferase family protein n=2 Tax=Dyadobacter psychrotolerans TaxID=2541721 RepID=A0A4R5DR31_9BACT|nr:alanine--glyoxylate aminotransferase family protein [Dyadobacter psychrotolerans]